MTNPGTFLSVDLKSWVFGTIKKVQQGTDWNNAWQKTYRELGGKSEESGKKVCPMKGTKTLYLLGRINGSNMPYKNPPPREVWENNSKNGVYALLALEILSRNPSISLNDLWSRIPRTRARRIGGGTRAIKSRRSHRCIQAVEPRTDCQSIETGNLTKSLTRQSTGSPINPAPGDL